MGKCVAPEPARTAACLVEDESQRQERFRGRMRMQVLTVGTGLIFGLTVGALFGWPCGWGHPGPRDPAEKLTVSIFV
jgi:hypothetical protein